MEELNHDKLKLLFRMTACVCMYTICVASSGEILNSNEIALCQLHVSPPSNTINKLLYIAVLKS